jgi:hypothetical protein
MKTWHIQSGNLDCHSVGDSADEALAEAVRLKKPHSLGVIAQVLEHGAGPISAVLLHTETILKKHGLWDVEQRVEAPAWASWAESQS